MLFHAYEHNVQTLVSAKHLYNGLMWLLSIWERSSRLAVYSPGGNESAKIASGSITNMANQKQLPALSLFEQCCENFCI